MVPVPSKFIANRTQCAPGFPVFIVPGSFPVSTFSSKCCCQFFSVFKKLLRSMCRFEEVISQNNKHHFWTPKTVEFQPKNLIRHKCCPLVLRIMYLIRKTDTLEPHSFGIFYCYPHFSIFFKRLWVWPTPVSPVSGCEFPCLLHALPEGMHETVKRPDNKGVFFLQRYKFLQFTLRVYK